jgi:hypothetical protein
MSLFYSKNVYFIDIQAILRTKYLKIACKIRYRSKQMSFFDKIILFLRSASLFIINATGCCGKN